MLTTEAKAEVEALVPLLREGREAFVRSLRRRLVMVLLEGGWWNCDWKKVLIISGSLIYLVDQSAAGDATEGERAEGHNIS